MFLRNAVAKHSRLLVTIGSLVLVLLAGTVSLASRSAGGALPPTLGKAILNPLKSTLPNTSQLDACVNAAILNTDIYAHDGTPITVAFKQQVTDAQLAKRSGLAGYHFGVLMNLVILKGDFHSPRSNGHVPYILYVMTPYPKCQPTLTMFNVTAFTKELGPQ